MKFGIKEVISRWNAGRPERRLQREKRRNKRRVERSKLIEYFEERAEEHRGDLGRHSPYLRRRDH